jgi:hypothetical protein
MLLLMIYTGFSTDALQISSKSIFSSHPLMHWPALQEPHTMSDNYSRLYARNPQLCPQVPLKYLSPVRRNSIPFHLHTAKECLKTKTCPNSFQNNSILLS